MQPTLFLKERTNHSIKTPIIMAEERTPISMSNTKKEMLEAYQALLKEVESKSTEEPKEEQKRLEQKKVVAASESLSLDGIEHFAREVTGTFEKAVTTLQSELKKGLEKLRMLNETIQIKEEWIKDLYAIESNADSLATLILAQRNLKATTQQELEETKTELEKEIEAIRTSWQKEKQLHEAALKQEAEERVLKRNREEEEYNYTTGVKRREEEDEFRQRLQSEEKELDKRKEEFEQEYSVRMKVLTDSEQELEELRALADSLEARIAEATHRATAETKEQLTREHRFEFDLAQKETEGQLKLKDQQIELLQQKIREMDTQLKEAGVKVTNSENTVRDIAFRAIESSASAPRAISGEQQMFGFRDKTPEA